MLVSDSSFVGLLPVTYRPFPYPFRFPSVRTFTHPIGTVVRFGHATLVYPGTDCAFRKLFALYSSGISERKARKGYLFIKKKKNKRREEQEREIYPSHHSGDNHHHGHRQQKTPNAIIRHAERSMIPDPLASLLLHPIVVDREAADLCCADPSPELIGAVPCGVALSVFDA